MGRRRPRTASGEGRFARKVPQEYHREDPNLSWFYRPHSITILILLGIVLVYIAFTKDDNSSSNVKYGLGAVCLVFLTFSMVQMRDGLFVRPHVVVWRIVMGCAILYLCLLVFLLFQSVDDARQLLKELDPALGEALPERSYAEECALFTPDADRPMANLEATVYDEFILAHFLGWWVKAIMFRDVFFSWMLSVCFELLELSLQHLLPNFKECWWDHWLLDVLICNAAGIYLGMHTCRLLQMKEYNWAGVRGGRISRALRGVGRNIAPAQYESFHWEVFSSPKRFFSVLFLFAFIEGVELSCFFLKFVLWIPPPHYINVARLALWCFIGSPALREFYQFATDSSCKKLGTMAWLAGAILLLEVLVCVKYGKGLYPNPWPRPVLLAWGAAGLLFALWCAVYWLWWFPRRSAARAARKAE